jgi:glycosyltransferase involved in cell wall biosynthesis
MIGVTHFMRRPRASNFSVERLFEDVRGHLPPDVRVRVCTNRFHSTGALRRAYDLVRARRHQGDVNHIAGDVHYLALSLEPRRTLLTILDCGWQQRSRGVRRWLIWQLWYRLPVRRCALISVISESTRQELLERTGCESAKVRVVPASVSPEFRPAPRAFDAQCPRILQVGTKANKNIEVHAAALDGIACRLVVIGELSRPQRAVLASHGVAFEEHVGLSRSELLEQYRGCDLLLFASTYEGFGLPIVEVQAVGRPVVTANVWSMPEVAGDAACLVDPHDVASVRAGVQRIIDDAAYRERLVARGFANVERFRAAAIAEQYAALYREIHRNGRAQ